MMNYFKFFTEIWRFFKKYYRSIIIGQGKNRTMRRVSGNALSLRNRSVMESL